MFVVSFDDLKTGLTNLRRKALQQNEGPLAFAKTNLTAFLDCYDMLSGVSALCRILFVHLLDLILSFVCIYTRHCSGCISQLSITDCVYIIRCVHVFLCDRSNVIEH